MWIALAGFVVHMPTAGAGGAVASPEPPAVAFLRSYRAAFHAPSRVAVDAAGNVYVTDPGRGQVVVRAPSGRILSRLGDLGRPTSVAVDGAGRVYVGDSDSGSVTAFSPDGHAIVRLGKGDGEFRLPNDLAIDGAGGNIFVVDSAAHLVKVYSRAGALLQSFGGYGSADGQFNFPVSLAIDATAGQVLVVDQLNYRIEIFDLDGTFQSAFGALGNGPGAFNMPHGVAIDRKGRVYVADSVEGRVQVLDRSGTFLAYIGDFGEAAGQLRIPMGMAIDPSNRLFIAAANNARLEVFGLDAFADPETVSPAVVHVEPNPIEQANQRAAVIGYIEVPGYPLGQIVPGSIAANGVTAATPGVIGDHDGNGVPDVRVEFDRASLLATFAGDGVATVTISGTIGGTQFEGSTAVQITTCGAGVLCSLGDADPRCNEAVCVPPIGCTIVPKANGASCEDGDACTIDDVCSGGFCEGAALNCDDRNVCTDDTCDPQLGCVQVNNTAPCDDGSACTIGDTCGDGVCSGTPVSCDDGNVCTDDTCDPAGGCVHSDNAAACDDGNLCTGPDVCVGGMCSGAPRTCDDGNVCTDDTCNPAIGCVHTNNTSACDDGEPGTARDICDGAGVCHGQVVTGNYAILSWPLDARGAQSVTLGGHAVVRGDVCAESMRIGSFSEIEGNVVAWASDGRAVVLRSGTVIAGDVVTGGGGVARIDQVTVGGQVDQSGVAVELSECIAARNRASSRRAELAARPSTAGFALGGIDLRRDERRRIPSNGTLGAGQLVVDVDELRLASSSALTLVGTSATDFVVVRVHGKMMLGMAARVATEGLPPERVLFLIDGPVMIYRDARVSGTLLAAGHVQINANAGIAGALFGSDIDVAASATIDLHSFIGW
ncbi:MAG TPA: hypothetical protein VMW17_07525 [Candidatus Binatia bacterium]|nr:hypothetical protein [Candidatus Binatia bacterium]